MSFCMDRRLRETLTSALAPWSQLSVTRIT
jgi:hypothetical protein